jgi:hypothetical protein
MPVTSNQENTLAAVDRRRGPSESQLAAVVEAAYILEALRK